MDWKIVLQSPFFTVALPIVMTLIVGILVQNKPIDDLNRSSSDIQRCTDVALDEARIQFHFDNLEARPRLAVAADPVAVTIGDLGPLPPDMRFHISAAMV